MIALSGVCRAGVDVIPIHYRTAAEVLPVVKTLLSPEGRATFDARTNALVLIDTDESIQRIRAFLLKYDTPVQQVRIRLKFHEILSSQERSVSASGGVSGEDWKISTGKKSKDGIEIQVDDKKASQRRTSEHFIITTSGSPAYILTGKEIPYRQRWAYLSRRYAAFTDTVVFRRIETGMEILPVIVGNHANIEVTPRISHVGPDGGKGIVRFTGASTQLSVPLGQWVEIGGTDEETNEVIRAILESGTGEDNSTLSISIKVETFGSSPKELE